MSPVGRRPGVDTPTIAGMSGDWGRPHFRRKVASELGITVEALDRALARVETSEHRADGSYRSLSQNERLKELAQALDLPLGRLAAVDGIASLVPQRRSDPARPPGRRPKPKPASRGTGGGRPRRSTARPKTGQVPLKKFPWELDAPPPRPTTPEREREGQVCRACGLPLHPLTGSCGCS